MTTKVRPEKTAVIEDVQAKVDEATAAAEAARTLFARTCHVHHDGAAVEGLTVHAVDGGLRLGIRGHFHKAEALGTTGLAVHHDLGRRDGTELRECLLERLVSHAVSEVAHV